MKMRIVTNVKDIENIELSQNEIGAIWCEFMQIRPMWQKSALLYKNEMYDLDVYRNITHTFYKIAKHYKDALIPVISGVSHKHYRLLIRKGVK